MVGLATGGIVVNDEIGGAGGGPIADGAVTTPKLADGSVTTPKLAANSITAAKLSVDVPVRAANVADLASLVVVDGQAVELLGYYAAGDGGGQPLYYSAASAATVNGGTVFNGPGGVGRFLSLNPLSINAKQGGLTGDGVTDDTARHNAVCGALVDGSELFFPPGIYMINRNAAGVNITASRVTIRGAGDATIIRGSITADNAGNENYNAFHMDGESDITIKDMRFDRYLCLLFADTCDNVRLDGVTCDSHIPNVSNYFHDKSLNFVSCTNVRISGCHFENFNFAVYLGGIDAERTRNVTVTGCTFEHTKAAGGYTSLFPVGVYVYYSDNVSVVGNVFKDIYSSLDNGTTGTGMGYGVYEGDGACKSLVVSDNTIDLRGRGSKRAIGIIANEAKKAVISDNVISVESGFAWGIQVGAKSGNQIWEITGNAIEFPDTAATYYGVLFVAESPGQSVNIDGNCLTRCAVRIEQIDLSETVTADAGTNKLAAANKFFDGLNVIVTGSDIPDGLLTTRGYTVVSRTAADFSLSAATGTAGAAIDLIDAGTGTIKVYPAEHSNQFSVIDNKIIDATYGIMVFGNVNSPIVYPKIQGNLISRTSSNAIYFGGYTIQSDISDNQIIDCCLSGGVPAVYHQDYSWGSRYQGNTVINTPDGRSKMTYVAAHVNNASDRCFKDLLFNNNARAMTSTANFQSFFDVSPTNGVFDLERGDQVFRSTPAATVPHYYTCGARKTPSLSTTAVATDTTIVLSSTTGILAGDLIMLVKNPVSFFVDYMINANWHCTTVASVTNGTDLVLTAAIPSGETYVAGVAGVYTARFTAGQTL